MNIEDLPIRFASVATEVGTGHEIWLKNGPLIDAMCASYALPGIFEPVRWGGRWLMDGALVNPVPVNVGAGDRRRQSHRDQYLLRRADARHRDPGPAAFHRRGRRARSAEVAPESRRNGIMSGLSRGAGLFRRQFASTGDRGPPGIASVMADAFNITQDRIMRSRLAGDPPDVLITARMHKIGLFEFHRADELIALGREAARKAIDEIRDHIDLHPPPAKSLPAAQAAPEAR